MSKATIHADAKFHSQMPFTNIDVCFHSREQLAALIAGLQKLLDEETDGALHLCDPASYLPEFTDDESGGLAASVCFHAPGYQRDDIDLRCLASARAHLESLLREGA
jgi:hypothetical protein